MSVVGIILAAGSSTRMGPENKLTKIWNGKPLVRHVADAAQQSMLSSVVVVTGHDGDTVRKVLPAHMVVGHNPNFASGMASTLTKGIELVEVNAPSGALILLGDMPLVNAGHIDRMIDKFDNVGCAPMSIVAAVHGDKRGNPVLFGPGHFQALKQLKGDRGARSIIDQSPNLLTVDIGPAALKDFDTPDRFVT